MQGSGAGPPGLSGVSGGVTVWAAAAEPASLLSQPLLHRRTELGWGAGSGCPVQLHGAGGRQPLGPDSRVTTCLWKVLSSLSPAEGIPALAWKATCRRRQTPPPRTRCPLPGVQEARNLPLSVWVGGRTLLEPHFSLSLGPGILEMFGKGTVLAKPPPLPLKGNWKFEGKPCRGPPWTFLSHLCCW